MRRRLAAILAADVVAYSRMMGANEDRTLAALREFRAAVFGPTVAGHRGRIIKSMGDGWLVEFDSTVDAVNCALRVQERLVANPLLRLRIGVHVGDIVHEDEDIFGDGVNIAARLQERADPGGIAISGSAYDSLDGTLTPGFLDAGSHELKNIARPVQVWSRTTAAAPAPLAAGRDVPEIFPRLAIRPIARDDDRPEIHVLADALAGDLAATLASSDWLLPAIMARPADRDYVVDASLRAMGEFLRLDLAVLAPDRETVWSGSYDGRMAESFEWRDKVGRDIAANIFGGISDAERQRLFAADPSDMSAADCLLSGVLEFYEVSPEALESALGHLARAIDRDPGLGTAQVQTLRLIFAAITAGYGHRLAPYLARVPDLLDAAQGHSADDPVLALCAAIWDYRQNHGGARLLGAVEDVLRRAPFEPDVLCLGGWCFVWLGLPQRALDCFRKFAESGPFSSLSMVARGGLAMTCVQMGRDHAAIENAVTVTRTTRDFAVPYRVIAAAAAQSGDMAQARDAVSNLARLLPEDTVSAIRRRAGFADTPANARFFDGLVRAGVKP